MRGFLVFFCFITLSHAQDERYFRHIYTGDLTKIALKEGSLKVEVSSPEYNVDLNRDGFDEKIVTSKRDGQDFLTIKDYGGRLIFETAIYAHGFLSSIYKMNLRTLNDKTDVLVVYFDEGKNESARYEKTARVYFLTIDGRNLKTLAWFKGPHYFHESKRERDVYWLRDFSVNFFDYNKDGTKEISVSFNKIQRIFFYQDRGMWTQI